MYDPRCAVDWRQHRCHDSTTHASGQSTARSMERQNTPSKEDHIAKDGGGGGRSLFAYYSSMIRTSHETLPQTNTRTHGWAASGFAQVLQDASTVREKLSTATRGSGLLVLSGNYRKSSNVVAAVLLRRAAVRPKFDERKLLTETAALWLNNATHTVAACDGRFG